MFTEVKRLIGRRFSDEAVQEDVKLWPFKVVTGNDERPMIVVQHEGKEKQFMPEEISSMVLVKMRETAEVYLGKKDQERCHHRACLLQQLPSTRLPLTPVPLPA
jgi:molecular chaperone DnaK (HSP70)